MNNNNKNTPKKHNLNQNHTVKSQGNQAKQSNDDGSFMLVSYKNMHAVCNADEAQEVSLLHFKQKFSYCTLSSSKKRFMQ